MYKQVTNLPLPALPQKVAPTGVPTVDVGLVSPKQLLSSLYCTTRIILPAVAIPRASPPMIEKIVPARIGGTHEKPCPSDTFVTFDAIIGKDCPSGITA